MDFTGQIASKSCNTLSDQGELMGVSTKEAPIHAVARDHNIHKRKKPEYIRLLLFIAKRFASERQTLALVEKVAQAMGAVLW